MPVVFACAASHAPGMTAWTEAAHKEQADRFLGCYRKLGEMLAASKPDALVAITVEHWANFFLNHMPAFCIGRAEHYDGPVEEWLRIPKARVPGDAKLAAQLIDACLDGGFDPTFSGESLLRARRVSRPGFRKNSKTNRTDRNRWSVALARRGEARKNQRSLRQNV